MPINIDKNLPAATTLSNEGIFVMTNERAAMQDIRPLKIAILNLMPTKETTETQLLRLLGNSPLQVEIILLRTLSHTPSHVSQEYLESFYHSFADIRDTKLDGLIITGAPVELMKFEDVDYWQELTEIMEWSKSHVYSTMHICWAAQAALYYHYGIEKHTVDKKVFGVFRHRVIDRNKYQLTRGFDDYFYAPHSRHTAILREDIANDPRLDILSDSEEAGVYLVSARGGRQIFVTGHAEYDRGTLGAEYARDVSKGVDIDVPLHYFPDDDPSRKPYVSWRSHAHLLFANWLNYYVYQNTPYSLDDIRQDD